MTLFISRSSSLISSSGFFNNPIYAKSSNSRSVCSLSRCVFSFLDELDSFCWLDVPETFEKDESGLKPLKVSFDEFDTRLVFGFSGNRVLFAIFLYRFSCALSFMFFDFSALKSRSAYIWSVLHCLSSICAIATSCLMSVRNKS